MLKQLKTGAVALIAGLAFILSPAFAQTQAISAQALPEVLQDWQDWVLFDHPEHACPYLYNEHTARFCAWPGQLTLEVQNDRIYFTQSWEVFADSTIQLPGDADMWPQSVRTNGQALAVIAQDGLPAMVLTPGTYDIQGYLPFAQNLPETLQISPHTALVQLMKAGAKVSNLQVSDSGQVWLQREEVASDTQDLHMRVFRKISQAVPLEVLTFIELDVSGPAREVQLGPVLLPDTVATRIDSPLPAQLDDNGLLRLQLRPGQWQVQVSARTIAANRQSAEALGVSFTVSENDTYEVLERAEVGPPWPAEEIWSFALDTRLGLMNVLGVPNVDPSQTQLPADWHALPAYRVLNADQVYLQHDSAIAEAGNQLALRRHMWLNFSGQLWTVQDIIEGQMTQDWRLSLQAPYALGRVTIDGQAQLITVLNDQNDVPVPGVEVRQGYLWVDAISLLDNSARLPVTGWSQDFNSASAVVNLPPGWQVLSAWGVDQTSGTWLAQWSLFDVFVVFIIALALLPLLGKQWSLGAVVLLLLIYHQVGAPVFIWLNIAVVLFLLQLLPQNRWRPWLHYYREASFAVLAVMIVFFSVYSLKASLYPQIISENPIASLSERVQQGLGQAGAPEADQALAPVRGTEPDRLYDAPPQFLSEQPARQVRGEANPFEVPVDAQTQTGPAQPQWQWSQVELNWQTQVQADQTFQLILISPLLQRLLAVVQIMLMVMLAWRLWLRRNRPIDFSLQAGGQATMSALLCACLLSAVSPATHAQSIPDEALLETLQSRLLMPDSCLPDCASMATAAVQVEDETLNLSLQIDAQAAVAIPIPGRSAYWQADSISVNGSAASGLRYQDNTLWLQLPAGSHTVQVRGDLADIDKLSLDFPLAPHWLTLSTRGWFAEGVDQQQLLGHTLHLTRRQASLDGQSGVAEIEPFVRVVRTLTLGIDGQISTRVERVAPVTGPLQVSVPLLAHETVTSEGVRVQNNRVQVTLAADQRDFTWDSTLAHYNDLTLLAPQTQDWVETWQVNIGPTWHPVITGITPLHESAYTRWMPTWQPWPGESVYIQLTRPPAMPGQTITVDAANLQTHVGVRGREMQLNATLRSTLGAQQPITLPEGAQIQSVRVNGVPQTVQAAGHTVTLVLNPGFNQLELQWQQAQGVDLITRTPVLDLGAAVYNLALGVDMPNDRWLLALAGPGYGPVTLYWMVLALLLGFAWLFARLAITPLKLWQWFVLGLGLSFVMPFWGLVVFAALLTLGVREKYHVLLSTRSQQALQLGTGLLLVASVVILFVAVMQGLRAEPNMQIFSSVLASPLTADFVWLQDISLGNWPRAWVISLPLWVFRITMLAWALWVVFMLLRWVPWAWRVMTHTQAASE